MLGIWTSQKLHHDYEYLSLLLLYHRYFERRRCWCCWWLLKSLQKAEITSFKLLKKNSIILILLNQQKRYWIDHHFVFNAELFLTKSQKNCFPFFFRFLKISHIFAVITWSFWKSNLLVKMVDHSYMNHFYRITTSIVIDRNERTTKNSPSNIDRIETTEIIININNNYIY